jgi:hypothetical protein
MGLQSEEARENEDDDKCQSFHPFLSLTVNHFNTQEHI